MSEKRTSAESRIPNDEEKTQNATFRQVDNAKRGKFASFSDTTLQDIPTEILQVILVKTIAMEVKNMKLAKSVWKEKADLVIRRLGTVCSQWNNVLTTDFFQIELHRALDGIAQETIRMEIVMESPITIDRCYVEGIATLKDDIFVFCRRRYCYNTTSDLEIYSAYNIKVYDRNNVAEVKDVIELSRCFYEDIAACNVSNCVYVLKENMETDITSVIRITKDQYHKFNIHSWISDLRWSVDSISVSDEGRVIMTSTQDDDLGPHVISVYNPNGLLHHEVILSHDVYGFADIKNCEIKKSNGNLVLGSLDKQFQMVLTEINTDGIIQRQYKSSLTPNNYWSFMSFAYAYGRILVHNTYNGIELLDSELNLLEFTGPQSNQERHAYFRSLHFNSQRNEVMGICSAGSNASILKIFRFIEE